MTLPVRVDASTLLDVDGDGAADTTEHEAVINSETVSIRIRFIVTTKCYWMPETMSRIELPNRPGRHDFWTAHA